MQELSVTELETLCGGDAADEIASEVRRLVESVMSSFLDMIATLNSMTEQELRELYEMMQHEEYAL